MKAIDKTNEIIVNHKGCTVSKNLLTNTILKNIKKELSLTPASSFGNFENKEIKVFEETNTTLSVPLYYAKTSKFLTNFKEMYNYSDIVSASFPEDNIALRAGAQTECYTKCLQELGKDVGGGIIALQTGAGKTILGVKLISSFKTKSLIIVNKIQLMKQWIQELTSKVPGIKIGIIQGKTNTHEGAHVTIGMVQTICLNKNFTCDSFKTFGLCVIDEVHGIASEVFSKIMFKIRPRYLFGLTATLERKDKMEKLLLWYIGDVIYSDTDSSLKQESDIRIVKYTGESSKELFLRDGTPAVSTMISNISLDSERTDLLANLIADLAKNKENHILVLADRTLLLKKLHAKLPPKVSGLFIGTLKPEVLAENKECQVILATYGMASEGFNVPRLNCLVFATPRSNIVQSIGRIYRKIHPIPPIIVDIVDNFSIFSRQQYARRKIYNKSISKEVGNLKEVLSDSEEDVCLIEE